MNRCAEGKCDCASRVNKEQAAARFYAEWAALMREGPFWREFFRMCPNEVRELVRQSLRDVDDEKPTKSRS